MLTKATTFQLVTIKFKVIKLQKNIEIKTNKHSF